jgi:hypothetical protein
MAARTVALTDTLETFRTTFNSLSSTDIGDPSSLTTTATSVVGAINELNASTYSGFTISDSASSVTQSIAGGDNVTFAGDSNITIAVSDQDTVTYTLNSNISGITSIGTVSLTASGTIEGATITENSVRVATRPFAIAQAVALG